MSHILLGTYLGVMLLDHREDLCLVFFFKKPPYCFPKWLCWLTFPPSVYEGSFFPATSPTFVVGVVLVDSHYNRSEVES
jgi:hypothetical protein